MYIFYEDYDLWLDKNDNISGSIAMYVVLAPIGGLIALALLLSVMQVSSVLIGL
jgi:hypothetical protein